MKYVNTKPVDDAVNYDELDPLCVPFVKYFNSIGLKTALSCQGHNDANLHKFYVEFARSVKDEDVHAFMNKFPKPFYQTMELNGVKQQIKGHFVKVLYSIDENGIADECWRYVSDISGKATINQKAAEKDLEIFRTFVPEKTQHFCQAEIVVDLFGSEKDDFELIDISFPKIEAEMDELTKILSNTSDEKESDRLVGSLANLDGLCEMFSEEIYDDALMSKITRELLEKDSTLQAYKIAIYFDNYREDRDYWTGEVDSDYNWDYEVLESGVDIGKYVTETQDTAIDWNKLHNTPGLSTGYFDTNGIEICVGDTVKEGCNGLVSKVVWNAERASFWLEGLGEGYGIENSDTEWEVVSDKEACIETYCKKDENFDFELT